MDVWLIGGGAYATALLFALALCKVAATDAEVQPGDESKRLHFEAGAEPREAPGALERTLNV